MKDIEGHREDSSAIAYPPSLFDDPSLFTHHPLGVSDVQSPVTHHSSHLPIVSVVVATLNRPHLLDRCVGALFNQTVPLSAYEVAVVDDGPHAATKAVVDEWCRRCPSFCVRYLTSIDRHGPAAARNVGWRMARAELMAFTDDDCIPASEWLRAGIETLSDPQVGAAWGRIVVPLRERPTDWERNVAALEHAPCATANCFYRRSVLEAVGGFDERFTEAWREDSDVQFGALARGVKIVHQPQAVVAHPVRPARWGISIALQRQNRFNALLYKKHPQLYGRFNPHEPPWAYYVTLGLVLLGALAAINEAPAAAMTLWAGWIVMAAAFCMRRLRGATHRPAHMIEMVVTSLIIPPYAVFWRLYGAVRYRVAFF